MKNLRQPFAFTLLFLFCLTTPYAAEPPKADKVFINANIYTANLIQPFAQALAIQGKHITYVGNNDDVEPLLGPNTLIVDLSGTQQVLPGFIDNHNHVFEAASEAGGNCELSPTATPSEQIPYLKYCLKNSKPDQWFIGWGHTIEYTMDENEEFTPLEIIDSIFTDRPIIIMEQTSHSMWVNSVALKSAGIDTNTPNPQGGIIMKDSDTGKLLGILVDNAGDIMMENAWNSLENKFSQSYDGLLNGLYEIAKNGITTIGDGRLYWKRGWYDVWKTVQADGELTARVSLRPWVYPHLDRKEQLAFFEQIHSSNKENLLITNQVKMYSDGIIVNATANVLAPYAFTYFPESPYGINYIPYPQMSSWLIELDKIGYGAHIHAIGDGAVRDSLDAIKTARQSGSKQKYNMTHIEMIDKKDINRFASLSVDADFQVGSEYLGNSDHSWAYPFIGKKRAHTLMPIRDVYESGANVTLSSDWNVNPLSPLAGIANAVKLKNKGLPNIREAINAYTINAAKALGLDSVTGSIEVGKSADIVILNKVIFDKSPKNIKNAYVTQTILQGKTVYAE